jgi:ATP synthase protein I
MQLALALFAAQAFVGAVLAGAWQVSRGGYSGAAALYGALIAVVPGFYFAWRLLRYGTNASPRRVARALYMGELGKLALTVAMFVYAAVTFGDQFLPVLTAYVACLSCYWLAMIVNR